MLDCMLRLCLVLQGIAESRHFQSGCFHYHSNEEFLCSASLPSITVSCVCLNFSHSKRYVVFLIVALICSSLMTNDFEYVFICLFVTSIFSEISAQAFCPLFNGIVCYLIIFVWLEFTSESMCSWCFFF